MLRFAALSIVVATLTGCAYHNPTAPTPPISDVAPAFLTLGVPAASNGVVTAYVQNAHGADGAKTATASKVIIVP